MKLINLFEMKVNTNLNYSPLLEGTNILDINKKIMLVITVYILQLEKPNLSSTCNLYMGLSSTHVINVNLGFFSLGIHMNHREFLYEASKHRVAKYPCDNCYH